MRTTIDAAGRIVIPKAIRDAAGLFPGSELEIEVRDGRIEIEPATVAMRVVARPGGGVLEAAADMPPLSAEDVRAVLEGVRR